MQSLTFSICAYKESPYLEECILSLVRQTLDCKIIMVTSTPNEKIKSLCERYKIPLFINDGKKGITQDWNFALSHVKTEYATIAHQDDIYEPDYAEIMIRNLKSCKKPLIAFSDYSEIRKEKKIYKNQLINIKKIMLYPLRIKSFWKNRFIRRRILSLGDPICCPSVMFVMSELKQPIFSDGYRSCEDWEAWEKISKLKGSFVYIARPLLSHRIHKESATTSILEDNGRVQENYEMYCKFWPKKIARIINYFYTKSEKSNKLEP